MSEQKPSFESRLVAGLQPVRELIRARGKSISRVFIDDRKLPRLDALERFARDQGIIDVKRVARDQLDRLTHGAEHQGVVAWGPELEFSELDDLLIDPKLIAIALDQIQDPQNFGAIVRSAVAIASATVIFGEHRAAPLTTATFRASAGAIEHARLCRVNSVRQALQTARDAGVEVIGLDARAPVALSDLPLAGPTILVVGSEHEGMARGVRQTCSHLASLPSSGKLDSLNASVAAGIALSIVSISRGKSA
jgi:23S rRNA (guanosine2251-2'-O)-methyltransferase